MSYTDAGQFERVTRGSTSFTNSALGLTREDATSFTHDPDGFLLGQRTPTRTYFLHDGLGSVVATTTEAGQESLTARYAPFGACLANCPTVPYRWLGGLGVYWDEPLQLYKMGTRYYDPALGRFTQVDPVEGGSANRYDYAFQNPINLKDLDGQDAVSAYGLWLKLAIVTSGSQGLGGPASTASRGAVLTRNSSTDYSLVARRARP